MDRLRYTTTESPTITIGVIKQSLRIKGWDRNEIRADGDIGNSLIITQKEDSFEINSDEGCMLRVPYLSNLIINTVNKDFQLKNIGGIVTIKMINGQAHIKNTNGLTIGKVNGDIYCGNIEGDLSLQSGNNNGVFKNIDGNLTIENLKGNLNCSNVDGSVLVQEGQENGNFKNIEGHLSVANLKGNLSISGDNPSMKINTKGNASLKFSTFLDGIYEIIAAGNIDCKLSDEADSIIVFNSEGGIINIKTDSINEEILDSQHTITLGNGMGEIKLTSGGNINFSSINIPKGDNEFHYEKDFENGFSEIGVELSNMANEISKKVKEEIGDHLNSLKGTLKANLGNSNKQTNRTGKKVFAHKVKFGSHGNRQGFQSGNKSKQHKNSEPVKDDERMTILEMIAGGTISVEQGEILLQALEGNMQEIPKPQTPPEPPKEPTIDSNDN